MLKRLKQQWRSFRHAEPGQRFQGRYWRARRSTHSRDIGPHVERIVLAVVAFVIGCALCFTPVPGIPFLAISAGLLASESLPLARALDRTELRLRSVADDLRRRWRALPWIGRALMSVILVGGATLEIYLLAELVRHW